MRRRLLWRNGEWQEIPSDYTPPRRKGPYIISDTHEPFKSMADGLYYDSKSAYRRSLRERGLTEVGNEPPTPPKFESDVTGKDIKDAIEQVKAGKAKPAIDRGQLEASVSKGTTAV